MTPTCRRPCVFPNRTAPAVATTCAVLVFVVLAASSPVEAAGSAPPERIAINDNRTPAGAQAAGTLTIRLEARVGMWHPDGDSAPGVAVKAFSLEGGPLQVPGPLIRVREGTEIRAIIRNTLDESLVVHGLYTRP